MFVSLLQPFHQSVVNFQFQHSSFSSFLVVLNCINACSVSVHSIRLYMEWNGWSILCIWIQIWTRECSYFLMEMSYIDWFMSVGLSSNTYILCLFKSASSCQTLSSSPRWEYSNTFSQFFSLQTIWLLVLGHVHGQ